MPQSATALAVFSGSAGSSGAGARDVFTAQNRQPLRSRTGVQHEHVLPRLHALLPLTGISWDYSLARAARPRATPTASTDVQGLEHQA